MADTPAAVQRELVAAAERATLAPSVHNTQPWRLEVNGGQVDVYADLARRLDVIDPTGRELTMSCGAAVLHLRAALAAAGLAVETVLTPDSARPELLASVMVTGTLTVRDAVLDRLDVAAVRRHTNRRAYRREPLPAAVIERLRSAAEGEGADLVAAQDDLDIAVLSGLVTLAADLQSLDPRYEQELRTWAGTRPARRDGVPQSAVAAKGIHTEGGVFNRDFDVDGRAGLPRSPTPAGRCWCW
jgi:hypothetical protein